MKIRVSNPSGPIYLVISILVSMIGYHIHGSLFWSVVDFIFWPLVLVKWLIFHEINITIIKETFSFFFR